MLSNFNKRLGQHFLTNKKLIGIIINIVKPKNEDIFLEIGAGYGAISNVIKNVNKLILIEYDKNLSKFLKKFFCINKNVEIYNKDILNFNIKIIKKKIRIIGNIPYNISTSLMLYISNIKNIKDIHFMIQKEILDNLYTTFLNIKSNKLSLLLQYNFKITTKIKIIKPENFYPKPKINSSFIKLKPYKKKYKVINEILLKRFFKIFFGKKRKTILNNLKNIYNYINPNKRTSNLNINEYTILTNLCFYLNKKRLKNLSFTAS